MKKIKIVFILVCLSFFGKLNAQDFSQKKWSVATGLGLTMSEVMNYGFAQGSHISYQLDQLLEFGLEFVHTFLYKLPDGKPSGLSFIDDRRGPNIQMASPVGSKKDYSSANETSINLTLGFNPLKFIKDNKRHSLFIGWMIGLDFGVNTRLQDETMMVQEVRYTGIWSYGPRASYEYRINSSLGVGLSASYNTPHQNFYSLANLVVHL